uniref:Transmembrane p24 trafficking protein 6 n=1 Tax=Oreochromis niloticus TaxID=8128 RepID=A0A669CGZ0_ORENI
PEEETFQGWLIIFDLFTLPNVTDQELFWRSDQYDFAIVLPAAGLEFFWHFAHGGERFYLNFMVQWVMGVGHDRHLSVTAGLLEFDTSKVNKQIFIPASVLLCQATTHKVETYVFHMFRHYGFSWKRESVDYFLLQSNSKYITWWSMALSLLIVTSGYLRLLFLKSLFVSNTGTEGEKPRC